MPWWIAHNFTGASVGTVGHATFQATMRGLRKRGDVEHIFSTKISQTTVKHVGQESLFGSRLKTPKIATMISDFDYLMRQIRD